MERALHPVQRRRGGGGGKKGHVICVRALSLVCATLPSGIIELHFLLQSLSEKSGIFGRSLRICNTSADSFMLCVSQVDKHREPDGTVSTGTLNSLSEQS